jgi:hypothetical protein
VKTVPDSAGCFTVEAPVDSDYDICDSDVDDEDVVDDDDIDTDGDDMDTALTDVCLGDAVDIAVKWVQEQVRSSTAMHLSVWAK